LGTYNSAAEFKDIVVTSNGVVLYQSDFDKEGSGGWTIMRGAWNVKDGAFRELATRPQCRAVFGDTNWANYTLTLRARRIGGQEGFMVYFNCLDPNNWACFNVAGWSNTLASVTTATTGGQWVDLVPRVPLSLETNVWYDVRVVLSGDRIECYVNSNLVQAASYPKPAPVAIAVADNNAAAAPQPEKTRPFPFFDPLCRGALGVGFWNTQVEFRNIVVTAHGAEFYRSDFTKAGMDPWLAWGGDWSVTNGVLRQSRLDGNGFAIMGSSNLANYTITLQVRKTGGDEGFRVAIGWQDEDNCLWFNAGARGNQTALIEENIRGHYIPLSGGSPLTIESNVWYDVKVVLSGARISCYVNSNLVQAATAEVGFSTNAVYLGAVAVPDGHVLKFKAGGQVFTGSLTKNRGWPSDLEPGSVVQVTGQIEPGGQGGPSLDAECDIELFSPDDVVTLQAPSWWIWQRILVIGGIFLVGLVTAAAWIAMISRKNRLLTNAQRQLQNANDLLEARVRDRTADLAKANTELEHEQALFRSLLNTSSDFIYFKDADSRFVRVSASLCKMAGLTHAQIVGKTDFDIFREEHARQAFADEQQIIRTGQPLIGKLEHEVHIDGHETWVLTTKMPWRSPEGTIVGTFGISHDVTAAKEAEKELERTHKQLVEASHAAGMAEVATGVLHNVGNVLNSVNVSTSLLIDRFRKSNVKAVGRVAALIKDRAADLGDFVNKDPQGQMVPGFLWDLSQQLAREQVQALEELDGLQKNVAHINEIVAMQQSYATVSGVSTVVNATELLDEALRLTESSLKRHGIALVKEFAAGLPDVVVDHHKVLQILVNLIRNAKQACQDSQQPDRQLTLRAAAAGEKIQISVIDNGVGIPAENLTRIFAHGFTTRKGGHGFGLHISALAAKDIGGQLLVHSDGPGRGAAFTLELDLPPEAGRSAHGSPAPQPDAIPLPKL
jgi:PAS domain S-box-containing protein